MSFHKGFFLVKATDLLTDQEHTVRVSENDDITTQEQAELHIATSFPAFGGKHPGSEVHPKDPAKYAIVWDQWVAAHPVEVKAILDRQDWSAEHPEEAVKMKAALAKAQVEAGT